MKSYIITGLVVLVSVLSCRSDEAEVQYPIDQPYAFGIPSNFPEVKYNLQANKPTEYGVQLGKKLFYDGRLAKDNAVACAFAIFKKMPLHIMGIR